MKKQVLITILFAMLMSMPMFAYDFEQNGIYYNIEGDHVSVTYSGNGVYSGSVSIPNQVTYGGVTYPVTAIGEWAFEGGEGITYLYIPSSITSIGEYAFIDCGSNIEVHIADLMAWCKVEFGNEHSSPLSSAKKFYVGSEVKQLNIPNGVEAIPNYAFYQCRSITSLYISGSVKFIGSSAFEDCTGLKWVCLSEGVESIGGSSFEGCTNLSTIILPSTLSSIALNAFKNCSNLNTIFSKIQEPFAFVDNVFSTYSTATVIVPEGTTTEYQSTDGWNLFDNITDDSSQDPTKRTIHVATAGTLPNLISADEKYQIEELTLTGELNGTDFKLIRDMAGVSFYFKNYQGAYYPETDGILWSLDLSNADIVNGGEGYVIADEGSPYYNKTRTISPEDYNYKYTKNNCISTLLFFKTKLKSIILPQNVTTIEDGAFKDCSVLTSIVIPNKVTSIGADAFTNCSGLTSITVESGNQYYDSRNDCNAIIETSSNTLQYGCNNTIIPNSVTSIGSSAFQACSGMTSVTIPNSVKTIGSSAFAYCSGLTSITIPNSVMTIGSSAFAYCSGLTSITIPNSVTSIGSSAFKKCSGLTSINIPYSVTSIPLEAFGGCSGLVSVTIPQSVTSISTLAFDDCSGLTSITIPRNLVSIGSATLQRCSGLTSIISLNDTPPTCDGAYVFNSVVFGGVDKENCILWVPKGSVAAYNSADGWKDFMNIKEIIDGDVNLDEKVNRNDQNALVAHVMGEKPEGFFEGLADLNGDDDVNAADVVKLVDILNNNGLSTEAEFGYDNVDGSLVVSSLTCTLKNERDEAILLTRCELYSNGSLLRTKSFANNPVSVAADGNKSCTFDNLSKPANSTDFTVCWHYTVNDESFVYRCPLTD